MDRVKDGPVVLQDAAMALVMRALGNAQRAMARGDLAGAAAACTEATALAPGEAAGFAMLALVRLEQSEFGAADEASRVALALRPEEPTLINLAAAIALRQGRWGEALAMSDRVLAMAPGNTRALADCGFALSQLGRHDDARRLLDFARLVHVGYPAVPRGHATLAAFNDVLADAIRAHPALDRQDGDRTLVKGSRLHDAFALDPGLARALKAIFEQAERDWTAAVDLAGVLPSHRRPGHSTIVAWANVMPAGAYERAHIHESAWLSGVYYAAMPHGDGQPASLVFGGHEAESAPPAADEGLWLNPAAGQIVVFPSWLYHRTRPTGASGQRISIAFDLVSA